MKTREPFDDELEAAFAALRAQAPRPDAALMGRVMDDAHRLVPGRRRGWLRRVTGGWSVGVPAGLAVSLVAGVWIGVSAPGPLAALDAVLWGDPMWQALADPAGDLALELAQ